MPAPESPEELIRLIRKSGTVDEQKLAAYLQQREDTGGLPDSPRALAGEMVRDAILTYFQSEQFLLGQWNGFTVGKFKLLERVGVGGMGQVFLCEHLFMKKRVAVKVLPPAKADQPAALGRFYREARAAGSLDHPNIIRTHDIDQDGELHYIVMDYVDGPNLLEVVKKFGPMDVRRAASYVRQTAVALDHAFRNGIIHRDVKPGNILIDRKGVARLLDLGLALFYKDHTDQLTLKYDDKIVLGTADYVAPEQVANSHAVDTRADIYALGSTFYYLLAGHPPFPSGTVSQKLLWQRTKEPAPIREVRPEVPEELAAVVEKMMAKDPKSRYQTPAQVAAELEPWVSGPVPLPAPEEMPQLSPAAMEGVHLDGTAEMPVLPVTRATPAPRPGAADADEAVPLGSKVAAGVAAASPFGRSGGLPWPAAPASARKTPLPGSVAPPSRPAAASQTPAATRGRSPAREQVADEPMRQVPWGLLVGALAAAAGLSLLLARLLG